MTTHPSPEMTERLPTPSNPWREAVEEALSNVHRSIDGRSPREALAALIEWNVTIALDPRVSSEAAALVQ